MKNPRKKQPIGVVVIHENQLSCKLLRQAMCAMMHELERSNIEITTMRRNLEAARKVQLIPFPTKPIKSQCLSVSK